jgi:hypothetical protein
MVSNGKAKFEDAEKEINNAPANFKHDGAAKIKSMFK